MLTARMKECLSAIERHLSDRGVAPSFDELKEALGASSKSNVHRLLSALEERGFIRRIPNRARAIEILKPQTSPSLDYWRGFADGAEAERRKMGRATAPAALED